MAKTIITIGREYCTGGNYIAEDVANAALFLASGMSTYITGQVIGVDGGMGC